MIVRAPLVAMRDYDFPVREPGYLQIAAATDLAREAADLWIADYVELLEESRSLGHPRVAAVRVAIPGDRAFTSYDRALANVQSVPLPPTIELPLQQAMLDVLLEWPVASDSARFSVDSRLAHLGQRTVTVLRYVTPSGAERAFQFTGAPGPVRLDPRWYQAAFGFVTLGFEHILDGIDHLLFLLCLVVPFRSFWALVPIVTSFTVAHSITLVASALGLAPSALWFPPLIETLIALSIVYMAFENIIGARLERRWMIAFGFGLVHGFGFAFALSESLQFAGAHLLTSLLSFNVGVEIGQLAVLVVTVPVLDLLFRKWLPEVMGVIVLSAFLAHTGWHWFLDRGSDFLAYDLSLPVPDATPLAGFLRWTMLALIVAGALLALHGLYDWVGRRFARSSLSPEASVQGPTRSNTMTTG
jgi:hypothetical protein